MKSRSLILWLLISLVGLVSVIGVVGYRADQLIRGDLLQQARMLAWMVNSDKVASLSGTESDLTSPDYRRIKEQLQTACKANPKCRFLYLMGQRSDGTIIILVDSEPPDSSDYSPPGQTYEEAIEEIHALFATPEELVEGPSSDRWGTLTSAFIPILDRKTGKMLAVFGMDIEASDWWKLVLSRAALPATLALLAGLLGLFLAMMRQANRGIREHEQKLQSIFRAAPVGLGMVRDRMILDVNDRFCEMVGYEREELINQSARMLYANGQEYESVGREKYRQIAEKGIGTVETQFRKKDGCIIHVLLRCAPSNPLKPKRDLIFTALDITERERSRRELEVRVAEQTWLLKSMTNAFAIFRSVFDAEGRFISYRFDFINDAYERITGVKLADVRDKTVHEVWPGTENSWVEHFGSVAMTGTARTFDQFHQPTGKLYHCCAYRPWDNREKFCVVFEDITDQKMFEKKAEELLRESDRARRALLGMLEDVKHAEDRYRKLNEELEVRVRDRTAQLLAANKELESFSYSVSHDLRTPLRSIDGFSQSLLASIGNKLPPDSLEDLNRVRKAAQKMSQLIDALLTLSRLARREMSFEKVDLSEIAREIAKDLSADDPMRRVELNIAESVGVTGDPQMLRIVLQNLLLNAWKFTRNKDQARIEFGTMERGGRSVIFVRDNGAGFDMRYLDKLFGAFQRLHAESEFEGTGIGLATVQRIIHRHGGWIWADSEVGKGATFFFTIGDQQKP